MVCISLSQFAIAIPHSDDELHCLFQTDNRVRLSPSVHTFLDDFRWLAQDFTGRSNRLTKILPREAAPLLSVLFLDAAGTGSMGGVESTAPTL
jgi:hypothetical protein